MRVNAPATRLTIFVDESDQWDHRPLHVEIVRRAREAGLAGASVLRGIEGYGASKKTPVAITVVDTESAIRAFLPRLDEVMGDGLVILDDIDARRFVRMEPDRLLPRQKRLHWPWRASPKEQLR